MNQWSTDQYHQYIALIQAGQDPSAAAAKIERDALAAAGLVAPPPAPAAVQLAQIKKRDRDYAEILAMQIQDTEITPPTHWGDHELQFAPPRKWRFDMAWAGSMIALEIEGGTWGKRVICNHCHQPVTKTLKDGRQTPVRQPGRHNSGTGYRGDIEKYNEAQLLGYLVLRVTPEEVTNGHALILVARALALKEKTQ